MRVRFSARTDVGMRREVNQDAYESRQFGAATLLVVCDGMGGHAAGEVASRLGVETIVATFSVEALPDEAMRQAFTTANQRIYDEGQGSMGTTGVAALFLSNKLYVANVGDSRAYLVREGQIRQISRDHSFVSDQVAAGLMTPEQARVSNIRNIITRALGHSPEIEVDIFPEELRAGDTVLLSSDGMHGLVTNDEIAEVAGMLPPEEAVNRLVDLANERGGSDNITVVIAQVDELDGPAGPASSAGATDTTITLPPTDPAPPTTERPLSRLGLALASLTLVALLSLGGYLWASSMQGLSASPAPTASAGTTAPSTASAGATAPSTAASAASAATPRSAPTATRSAPTSAPLPTIGPSTPTAPITTTPASPSPTPGPTTLIATPVLP